jgi:hypothetical protein
MTGHLGYAKRDPAGAGADNIRNGSRSKTVLIDATGHVEIDVVPAEDAIRRSPGAAHCSRDAAASTPLTHRC